MLGLNAWVIVGCVTLQRAIDKLIVDQPSSLIQSLFWMFAWPCLWFRALWQLFGRGSARRLPRNGWNAEHNNLNEQFSGW